MTVVGVAQVRDEADILEASARHMLAHCDRVLIEDHCSLDDTPKILWNLAAEYDGRLLVSQRSHPQNSQADISALWDRAGELGAWVVPFDADEFWLCPRLATWLPTLPADHVTMTVYEHAPRPGPGLSAWRHEDPWPFTKVAVRSGVSISHGHHFATNGKQEHWDPGLSVRHFPWRNPTQAARRIDQNITRGGCEVAANVEIYVSIRARFESWWAEKCNTPSVFDPVVPRCG